MNKTSGNLTRFVTVLIAVLLLVSCFLYMASFASDDTPGTAQDTGSDNVDEGDGQDDVGEHDFMFEPANFVLNLKWMAYGMLGVFAVIAVIIAITALLNKCTGGRHKG